MNNYNYVAVSSCLNPFGLSTHMHLSIVGYCLRQIPATNAALVLTEKQALIQEETGLYREKHKRSIQAQEALAILKHGRPGLRLRLNDLIRMIESLSKHNTFLD